MDVSFVHIGILSGPQNLQRHNVQVHRGCYPCDSSIDIPVDASTDDFMTRFLVLSNLAIQRDDPIATYFSSYPIVVELTREMRFD